MQKKELAYGTWPSSITPERVALSACGLSQVKTEAGVLYWLEQRPEEGGRRVIMQRNPVGEVLCLTPKGVSVRTRVHEYGGGDYCVHDQQLYFANDADQRWYAQVVGESALRPITPASSLAGSLRYADASVTPDGRWLIAVRERHVDQHEVINDIVAIDTQHDDEPRCLVSGSDFYAFVRVSPDGKQLAWIAWDHPEMPWDGTSLWVADLAEDGALAHVRCVAGGSAESIYQPDWSPSSCLHFVSDRSGWWNIYKLVGEAILPVLEIEADAAYPLWIFGTNTYAFLSEDRLAVLLQQKGLWQLGIVQHNQLTPCPVPFNDMEPTLAVQGDQLFLIAANAVNAPALIQYDSHKADYISVRPSAQLPLDESVFSHCIPIEFPSAADQSAHGFFYPPCNPLFKAPAGEKPPLLMISHGGPTGSARTALNLKIQYWTSRGFAVMDVNYSGSTGYGRAYRDRLKKQWGVSDVEDCVSAARFLVAEGRVDPNRLVIRGSSAGGYTTLCALTFHDVFVAGASYYGVADLHGLLNDTHKFEARYLDGLIGSYPEEQSVYEARSPLRHADKLTCPVIFLQGLEDKVVPPAQAESMIQALNEKQVPHAYVTFEKEQHGFRGAENIQRAIESELFFYGQILGFKPADTLPEVEIMHWGV